MKKTTNLLIIAMMLLMTSCVMQNTNPSLDGTFYSGQTQITFATSTFTGSLSGYEFIGTYSINKQDLSIEIISIDESQDSFKELMSRVYKCKLVESRVLYLYVPGSEMRFERKNINN